MKTKPLLRLFALTLIAAMIFTGCNNNVTEPANTTASTAENISGSATQITTEIYGGSETQTTTEYAEKTTAEKTTGVETTTVGKYANNKLRVVFTIDVEDKRGNEPNLIEGDLTPFGLNNCGVDYIMRTFESYGARAVFFVNVYEQNLYDSSYMPSLLKKIDAAGHEVGLHTHHPHDSQIPVYGKNICYMTEQEMEALFKYGSDYIYNVTGKRPISYRSGAYQATDDIFKALANTGFLIDSSVFYGNENNRFEKYKNLKNQTFKVDGITEFPVIAVFNGRSWRKLDLDSLTADEMKKALEIIRTSGQYETVQIMFHSFTFLDCDNVNGGEMLKEEGDRSIYGENYASKQKLTGLLDWMKQSGKYEIITFREYLDGEENLPSYDDDNLIYLANKNLAGFGKKHVSVTANGSRITMRNDFVPDVEITYAWVITSEKTGEYFAESGYSTSRKYVLDIPPGLNDTLYIKAYVRDGDDRVSGQYYKVVIENGVASSVQEI